MVCEVMGPRDKAKIPTMTKTNARVKLEGLFNKWKKLEMRKKKFNKQDELNKVNFTQDLDVLFDIVSSTWEKEIKDDRLRTKEAREEDLMFLADQRVPRQMYMDKEDTSYTAGG